MYSGGKNEKHHVESLVVRRYHNVIILHEAPYCNIPQWSLDTDGGDDRVKSNG